MEPIGDLNTARAKVMSDIGSLVAVLSGISAQPFCDAPSGIALLSRIRREVYEDLNQIQHEYAILCAVEWLAGSGRCKTDTIWSWNPRQTGDTSEPDLRGHVGRNLVISAEVTTSAKPDGVIDTRMAKTLAKLSRMRGQQFYFVLTGVMAQRALTKVRKAGYQIGIVDLCSARGGDVLLAQE